MFRFTNFPDFWIATDQMKEFFRFSFRLFLYILILMDDFSLGTYALFFFTFRAPI